ncbi:MAG: matrixin family metalloprotease [Bacteroidota bacterium]
MSRLLILLFLWGILGLNMSLGQTPCEKLLTIRVGQVDPRYSISQQELKDIIQDVASLWNSAIHQPVVSYTPQGSIPIHLIYSKKQQQLDNRERISDRIDLQQQRMDRIKAGHDSIAQSYRELKYEYNDRLNRFNRIINDYNRTVQRINTRGGANPKQDSLLHQQKMRIDSLKQRLDQFRLEVDNKRNLVNDLAATINRLAAQANADVQRYNQQYGRIHKFNQGRYSKDARGERIDIYQFSNRHDLRMVITHEVGHALGIDHVSNPASIMYYLRDQQDIQDLKLTAEDIAALKKQCQ